MYKISSMKR